MNFNKSLFYLKIISLIAAIVLIFCPPINSQTKNNRIRIMTYNIHHGEGIDGKVDVERIAKLIDSLKVDLVALQEVDRGVERTKKIDIMKILSDKTGLNYSFFKNIDYQGGEYGNGILSRFPIVKQDNLHYKMIREGEQRGLLQTIVKIDEDEIAYMNTHIDYRQDDTERVMNVEEIRDLVKTKYNEFPMIICGDFNDLPESRTHVLMKENFVDIWELKGEGDGFTYPTENPEKRIDYIFFRLPEVKTGKNDKGKFKLNPLFIEVIESTASDHLPLVSDFEIERE